MGGGRSRPGESMPVHLYADRGSPKYGRAAMRWLERYRAHLRRAGAAPRAGRGGGVRLLAILPTCSPSSRSCSRSGAKSAKRAGRSGG
jgi:hypothetical protein